MGSDTGLFHSLSSVNVSYRTKAGVSGLVDIMERGSRESTIRRSSKYFEPIMKYTTFREHKQITYGLLVLILNPKIGGNNLHPKLRITVKIKTITILHMLVYFFPRDSVQQVSCGILVVSTFFKGLKSILMKF